MSCLLSIALGPVQEFIGAARRTGDLAAGSQLLAAVAQTTAKAVQCAGGNLIFPADPDAIGPNKILAELPAADASEVAKQAKAAAQDFLRRAWGDVYQKHMAHLSNCVDATIATAQIDGFLEFYAAWWPLDGLYPEARREVERLLAGRKALRSFDAPPQHPGRPKSPLDPSRDCALRTDRDYTVPEECRRAPLWLKPRETLDAVSLLKRLRVGSGIASTSLMAVRSVLARMREQEPDVIREMQQIAEKTNGVVDLGDLFFPERVVDEARALGPEVERVRELRKKALNAVRLEEAPAYYAVLVADGDRMGQLIEAQADMKSHRRLSRALSEFAQGTEKIVCGFDGHPVYSGGDDVLALVPANAAIGCARRLQEEFVRRLDGFKTHGAAPGLSAGTAIVHHLTPLQTALEHARSAERIAKQTHDSLAVALHVRGGAPLTVSLHWDQIGAWDEWTDAFRAGLARGVPYELIAIAREWRGAAWPDPKHAERRLQDEARRIFERKEGGSGRTSPTWVTDACSLDRFASLLAIARFLSRLEARMGSGQSYA